MRSTVRTACTITRIDIAIRRTTNIMSRPHTRGSRISSQKKLSPLTLSKKRPAPAGLQHQRVRWQGNTDQQMSHDVVVVRPHVGKYAQGKRTNKPNSLSGMWVKRLGKT